MPTVTLIRPGCTDFDEQHRVQGCLDLPLNRRGTTEVAALVAQLGTSRFEIIYTSPCEPARGTAAAVGTALGIPVKELEGLKNLNHGLWQGLQIDELRRKHPKVFKQWTESPECVCPPQGELVSDALERIRKTLDKPLQRGIPFAVCAPEPLATLIAYLLAGRRPNLAECPSNERPSKLWEELDVALPIGGKLELAGARPAAPEM